MISPSKLAGDHVTSLANQRAAEPVLRDYVCPVVVSVCAECVVCLCSGVNNEISGLLLELLKLYCADSAFSLNLLR